MMLKLNALQKSALQELGNIGSGHSAFALSELLNKRVMITVPNVRVEERRSLKFVNDFNKNKITLVGVDIVGDVFGALFFTFEENAFGLSEDRRSQALEEISAIIGDAYLNSVNQMLNLSLSLSQPEVFVDSLDVKLPGDGSLVCVSTAFVNLDAKLEAHLLFGLKPNSIEKLMKALGVS